MIYPFLVKRCVGSDWAIVDDIIHSQNSYSSSTLDQLWLFDFRQCLKNFVAGKFHSYKILASPMIKSCGFCHIFYITTLSTSLYWIYSEKLIYLSNFDLRHSFFTSKAGWLASLIGYFKSPYSMNLNCL